MDEKTHENQINKILREQRIKEEKSEETIDKIAKVVGNSVEKVLEELDSVNLAYDYLIEHPETLSMLRTGRNISPSRQKHSEMSKPVAKDIVLLLSKEGKITSKENTEEKMQEQNLGAAAIQQTRINERARENQMQRARQEAVRMEELQQQNAKKDHGKVVTQYSSMNQAVIVGKPHVPNLNGGERDESKTTEEI